MASVTQLLANRSNALKSTGPVTIAGKAKASRNAVRHGLLSARLLLEDESWDEFDALLDGLAASLHPVGTLEFALVERIAVALWRQHRLIRAEAAGIELSRGLESATNREQIQAVLGRGLARPVSVNEVQPLSEAELHSIAHLTALTREHETLGDGDIDLDTFAASAPHLYADLRDDAASEEVSVSEFVSDYSGGLQEWIQETLAHYRAEYAALQHRLPVLTVGDLVKSQRSAPIDQELLARYQTALDNDLVKAIKVLRETQEWRLHAIEPAGAAVIPV